MFKLIEYFDVLCKLPFLINSMLWLDMTWHDTHCGLAHDTPWHTTHTTAWHMTHLGTRVSETRVTWTESPVPRRRRQLAGRQLMGWQQDSVGSCWQCRPSQECQPRHWEAATAPAAYTGYGSTAQKQNAQINFHNGNKFQQNTCDLLVRLQVMGKPRYRSYEVQLILSLLARLQVMVKPRYWSYEVQHILYLQYYEKSNVRLCVNIRIN